MKNSLLILLLLLFSKKNYAQWFKPMSDQTTFEKKLQEIAQNTNTLTSDFAQIKHLEVLEEDIVSEGSFCFKKDKLLRWEYAEPLNYVVVLNGGKIDIKDEGDVSSFDLSDNKSFKKVNDMIIQSIRGDVLAGKDEYDYDFLENKDFYLVKMFPKKKEVKDFLEAIEITFSRQDYMVEQVKMLEKSGDFTTIKFKNRTVNKAISDEKFVVD